MTASFNARAGSASFSIDGVFYDLVGEPKWRVATLQRETLTGLDGVHGYKQTPMPGFISVQLRDGSGVTIGAFTGMNSVTVALYLLNGKTITGTGMWQVGDPVEVDSSEATYEVRFEGPRVEEIGP